MNPFDAVIFAVLALSVVYAIYRGAVQTVLNVGALILAVLLAYPLSAPLSEMIVTDSIPLSTGTPVFGSIIWL